MTQVPCKCEKCGCEIDKFCWSEYCACYVCPDCNFHQGIVRCYCGWTASGQGDGRKELIELGETIDPEPDCF
jgi:hypothetical protein